MEAETVEDDPPRDDDAFGEATEPQAEAAEEQVALRAGLPPRRITSNTVIELFARPARVENVEMRELSLEERDGLSSAGSGSLEVPLACPCI